MLLLIFGVIIPIFLDTSYFFSVILNTLEIWVYKVLPSIFCFYLFSSIIIYFDLTKIIFYPLKKITPFFHFDTSKAKDIFFISFLTGNPASSRLICDELVNNSITLNDACRLNKCSHFINPLFIVASLSIFDYRFSILLIFSLVISNIILAWLVTRKKDISHDNFNCNFVEMKSFKALDGVIDLVLSVASIMILCNVIKESLMLYLKMIGLNHQIFEIIFSFIEISSGFNTIISLGLDNKLMLIILGALASFGSISMIFQVANIINKNLSIFEFVKYRVINVIFVIIILVLCGWII